MELVGLVHPFHGPVGLLLDDRHILDGIEQIGFLICILNISVNEQGVSFRVDVLHGNLKPIEAPSLGDLNLGTELICQILEDDPIAGCEEG